MAPPKSLRDRVLFLREGGHVERSHNVPHHGSYSVGKHTFDMMCLLFTLYPGDPPTSLIKAVLFHDHAERIIGDSPAPAKWAFEEFAKRYEEASAEVEEAWGLPKFSDLSLSDRHWLKALDAIEFWLWTEDQVALGNRHIENCREQINTYLSESSGWIPAAAMRFIQEYNWGRTPERLERPE